ncbi:hypothetical protein Tco_0763472 [Tanacetum coccineum]
MGESQHIEGLDWDFSQIFGQRSDGEEHKEDCVLKSVKGLISSDCPLNKERGVVKVHIMACALDQLKQNATKAEILFFGRTVFQDTFRKMCALSSYIEALTPMPEDGGHRIKGLFGLTYLGDMGAEMCVLGYGSGGMVQRKWSMGCGSGVVLYLVVLYGVWFRGCGSRGLVKRLG